MSKPPSYTFRTLEDIVKVINEEKLETFLKDFSKWISFHTGLRMITLPNEFNIRINSRPLEMNWIDDGKNDVNINIKIVSEE